MRQVGSELGARYVLDGSLRIAGNTLRISCVLIDATSGKHIWAERYDGVLEDVFDLQDRITSSIVATIQPKMMRAEIARAQAKPTDNLSAYDLYLRAIAGLSPNIRKIPPTRLWSCSSVPLPLTHSFRPPTDSWPAFIGIA